MNDKEKLGYILEFIEMARDLKRLNHPVNKSSNGAENPIRHIIPISGKDSLATAIVQREKQPELPYEYVFNPTGAEFPEVIEWIKKVEAYLGSPIVFVGADLMEIIEDYNYFLPSSRARYCTRQAKIEPFEKWIGKDEAMVYYGIRADEKRQGYSSITGRITPVMPLVEAGYGINDVYRIIDEKGLKPPSFFWPQLYVSVAKIVGTETLQSAFNPWQKAAMFAGRSRANCYFCFNQRLYEWAWLYETHRDLFDKAEAMEHLGGDKKFTWHNGESLESIGNRYKDLREKRARSIAKIIWANQQGVLAFPDDEDGFNDTLATTSCGLFCGK